MHSLIYYYSLLSILASASISCTDIYGKRLCCIKHENLTGILSMLSKSSKHDGYDGVRIALNTFGTIIEELHEYGIITVMVREGDRAGRGYKRLVVIYDLDIVSKARRCLASILSRDLINYVEEKMSELKNGNAQRYFNDLSIGRDECIKLLRRVLS